MDRRIALCVAYVVCSAGCSGVSLSEVDDAEPFGSVSGRFSCPLAEPGDSTFDLGVASFDGDMESTVFLPGLRTQGCFARVVNAERGSVISVVSIQQTRFQRSQVLELNFPVETLEMGSPLFEDDSLVFVGRGGFGSLYTLDVGESPNTFARVVGGTVLLSEWSTEVGRSVSGSFDGLRVGEL